MTDEQKEETRKPMDLNLLAQEAYALDQALGKYEPDDMGVEDISVFFNELHGGVSGAYESWRDGADPSQVTLIGGADGMEAIATGLPVDLADILLDVLSLMRFCKIDIVDAVGQALDSRRDDAEMEGDDEEGEDEGEPAGDDDADPGKQS